MSAPAPVAAQPTRHFCDWQLADRACDEAVAPEATYIFFNAPDLRQHDIDRQQQQIADEVQLYFRESHIPLQLRSLNILPPNCML